AGGGLTAPHRPRQAPRRPRAAPLHRLEPPLSTSSFGPAALTNGNKAKQALSYPRRRTFALSRSALLHLDSAPLPLVAFIFLLPQLPILLPLLALRLHRHHREARRHAADGPRPAGASS
ncbi:hypothetical protein DV515_00005899, partial [Chloebia gouldiae]